MENVQGTAAPQTSGKVQDSEDVLAYMFHRAVADKDGSPKLHDGKAMITGSPIFKGRAATVLGIDLAGINSMVNSGQATVWVNGTITVWKLSKDDANKHVLA